MRSVSIISALALVGSTLAAPVAEPKLVVVTQTAVTTITQGAAPTQAVEKVDYRPEGQGYRRPDPVTIIKTVKYGGGPRSTQQPPQPAQPTYAPAPPPPAPSSEAPKPTYAPAPPPPAPSSEAPKPTYAPEPSTGGSGSYIDIVNKWRAKIDREPLKQDAQLESNAQVTCNEGNGNMKHKMGTNTRGQVLAPVAPGADATDFEKVFVGGWLCEVSSDPGLGAELCNTISKGYNLAGQRGHYDILKDAKYTKIGCAYFNNIWACDVGM